MQNILITGGAGYIGSHFAVLAVNEGRKVSIIDNFATGHKDIEQRIKQITGKRISVFQGDITDPNIVHRCLKAGSFDAIFHFAGLKSVPESIEYPQHYYQANSVGTLNLLTQAIATNKPKFIFSSTAAVYETASVLPFSETESLRVPENPYAKSKFFAEHWIRDISTKFGLSSCALRYFNPAGYHRSGLLDDTYRNNRPQNIFPALNRVADGVKKKFYIFGNDYNTKDGTCVRDYIHIDDLCVGHFKAADRGLEEGNFSIFNVGSGRGYSVLQIVEAYKKACEKSFQVEFTKRRPGDRDISVADISLAREMLDFRPSHSLEDICTSSKARQR